VTAVDADFGQRVEHVIDRGEHAAWRRCGLTESAEVQPDYIAFDGECRSDRVPHPAIGDAGMEKDDRQVTTRACTVVGDTGGRSRTRGHGLLSWRCEVGLAKHSAVDRTTGFLAAGHWGGSPRWQRSTEQCSHPIRLVDGRRPEHTHRGANCLREMPGQLSAGLPIVLGETGTNRARLEPWPRWCPDPSAGLRQSTRLVVSEPHRSEPGIAPGAPAATAAASEFGDGRFQSSGRRGRR
jgi:hypothetical protein